MPEEPTPADPGHPHQPLQPGHDYLASTAAMFDVTPATTTLLPPPRRRRPPGAMVLATAVAVAVVLAGGTFTAVHLLAGGKADPAKAAPASTFAIVQVDLDPSASQKLGIYRFSKRFPQSPTAHKGDSKSVVDTLLSSVVNSADADLDYERDVKPWLGGAAAFAAYTAADGKVKPIAILGYDDKAAAEKALTKASSAGDGSGGYSFVDDEWVVLAPSADAAKDAATAARQKTLAESSENYRHDLDGLDGDPVITAWGDLNKGFAAVQNQLGPILQEFAGFGDSSDMAEPAPSSIDPSLLPKGRIAVGVSLDNDVAQVQATAYTDEATTVKGSTDAARYVRNMPKDTTVAIAAGDLRPGVKALFEQIDKTPFADEFHQGVDQAERESGLTLPEDITEVMGDAVAVAYQQSGEQVAVRAHPEHPDDARRVLDKLATLAAEDDEPFEIRTDGRDVVLSGTASYAKAVASGSGLTDSDLFRKAVGDVPDSLQLLAFVDLSELLGDAGETAAHFRAAGMKVDTSSGKTSMVVRLVVR